MKSTLLTGMLMAASLVSAQEKPALNRWSLDMGLGVNKAMNPYTAGYSSNTICFPAVELGGRYMFSPNAGIRAELGYSQVKLDEFGDANSLYFKSHYWRVTVDGVVNLGHAMQFSSFCPRLGLLGYLGGGVSSMMNDSLKLGTDNGSDEMLHFTAGLQPQYRITDRVAVYLNFRAVANMYQSRTIDMRTQVADRGLDGFLLTGTAGVNIYLGKHAKHADWYDERTALEEALRLRRSRYDSLVEAMRDGDGDGVPDYLDQEPATAEGASVNVRGVTLPPDAPIVVPEDEVETIDGFVEFPEKTGLFFTVQVGCYREQVNLEEKYGLSPLMKVTTTTGEQRYLYGIFGRLADAQRIKDIVFESGVPDAFVAAYYQGKRITIAQAEKLLQTNGKMILEPGTM